VLQTRHLIFTIFTDFYVLLFDISNIFLVYYKNGDLQDCINKLQEQFAFTKLPVKQVYQTIDNKLKVIFESNYLIIDLSVL
jgi:hypothetical protein